MRTRGATLAIHVYSSKEQSQSERVVFAINDQIDDHCPKCINDTVYVEKLISLPIEQGEVLLVPLWQVWLAVPGECSRGS